MGFIPSLLEGTAVTAASYFLLGLSFVESGMLGFILAAVSPAVVIPAMLDLKDEGLGKKHEVPTLVLSGTSMDVVVAITVFGVFAGLAAGGSADWTYLLLGVPSGILLGGAIGVGIGLAFMWIFGRFEVPDTMKVILFMIVAVVFYDFAARPAVRQILPIAALLGIMASGFVILEKNSDLAHRLASKFAQVWVLAEILLFVYIGAHRSRPRDPGDRPCGPKPRSTDFTAQLGPLTGRTQVLRDRLPAQGHGPGGHGGGAPRDGPGRKGDFDDSGERRDDPFHSRAGHRGGGAGGRRCDPVLRAAPADAGLTYRSARVRAAKTSRRRCPR
jgi:hypothetical protein